MTVLNIIIGPTFFALEYSVFLWVKQDPHPTSPPSLAFSRYMQIMVCHTSNFQQINKPILLY